MKFVRLAIAVLLALPMLIKAQTAQYFQDFSAAPIGGTNFGDGSEVIGAAGVQSESLKELLLSPKQPATGAAFLAPPLASGKKTLAFSAKWNTAMIFDSTDAAGEGLQFSFARIRSSDALNTWSSRPGLSFRIQTADGTAAYVISVNGIVITNKPFVPAPNSNKRRYFEVDWRYTNGMTVKLDGLVILSAPTPNFIPSFEDRFAWISKNGAGASEVALDNIAIVTGGTLAIVPGSGFFASQRNPNYGPMRAYDDDNESEFAVFANSGFVGGNVAPARSLLFYSFTSGIDAPDPHNWTLEGGPNSTGPWTTVATGDWNFLTRQETRIWPVTNSTAFPSFRFSFPTNNSATLATYIGDLRLLEFKPCTPPFVADARLFAPDEIQLTFSGTPSSNQVAQFTTDFISWTDFATNAVPETGEWTVRDTNTASSARFYRLR